MNKKIAVTVSGLALGLLALAPASAQAQTQTSVSLTGEHIDVIADDSDNYIHVADQIDPECPQGPSCIEIATDGVIASDPCIGLENAQGDTRALCPFTTGLVVYGREGNDTIVVSDFALGHDILVGLQGGPGDDTLEGSNLSDTIYGNEGNDMIRSRDGADYVLGNSGRDHVYGSKGKDTIRGGPGFDDLIGGLGNDFLVGGAGNDGMDGAQGRDICFGGKGRDTSRRCERVR